MDDALLSTAERVTKGLLESHFEGKASFPQVSAQRRTSMDDSEYVQILIVFDGDMEIIDDPLWYKHDWHAKVDDLFEDDLSVIYKLDKSKYTKKDDRYLDKRID